MENNHRVELQFSHLFNYNPNLKPNLIAVKVGVHKLITQEWENWLSSKGGLVNITAADVEQEAKDLDKIFSNFFIACPWGII